MRRYTSQKRQWLREARKAKGFSAKELAEKLGVKPRSLFRWESGEHAPPIDKLFALARFLGDQVIQKFKAEFSNTEGAA